eukprot:201039_1
MFAVVNVIFINIVELNKLNPSLSQYFLPSKSILFLCDKFKKYGPITKLRQITNIPQIHFNKKEMNKLKQMQRGRDGIIKILDFNVNEYKFQLKIERTVHETAENFGMIIHLKSNINKCVEISFDII